MIDKNELITVTSHLKKEEADRIKRLLNSVQINSIVSGHDAASRHSSLYYQIGVKREDFRSAKHIIDKEKVKIFIEGKKCPECEYLGYREIEKKGLWQRLLYVGTTLVQCKKCKHKYGI
jgi:hypothetical protein